MGVERVDYYSDEEYEQALAQEAQQPEPDVVPCPRCGNQMWETEDLCSDCLTEYEKEVYYGKG